MYIYNILKIISQVLLFILKIAMFILNGLIIYFFTDLSIVKATGKL